ncbi:hypothetical protein PUN28_008758 [Cardiocondyla obscurior]|uniref:Uncharacterized protein n=1 Tax=Cardiocondyla obscurior TaxID=286306 RepID=A0AAW2G5H4_9HYME
MLKISVFAAGRRPARKFFTDCRFFKFMSVGKTDLRKKKKFFFFSRTKIFSPKRLKIFVFVAGRRPAQKFFTDSGLRPATKRILAFWREILVRQKKKFFLNSFTDHIKLKSPFDAKNFGSSKKKKKKKKKNQKKKKTKKSKNKKNKKQKKKKNQKTKNKKKQKNQKTKKQKYQKTKKTKKQKNKKTKKQKNKKTKKQKNKKTKTKNKKNKKQKNKNKNLT